MSIRGIGIDLVNVAEFDLQLGDPASEFARSTFTAAELADARRGRGGPALHLAARFAAKEAFVKAWGATRLGAAPALAHLDLRSIEVRLDTYGRPFIRLHEPVGSMIAAEGEVHIQCSLTHEAPVAAAVVIIEEAG